MILTKLESLGKTAIIATTLIVAPLFCLHSSPLGSTLTFPQRSPLLEKTEKKMVEIFSTAKTPSFYPEIEKENIMLNKKQKVYTPQASEFYSLEKGTEHSFVQEKKHLSYQKANTLPYQKLINFHLAKAACEKKVIYSKEGYPDFSPFSKNWMKDPFSSIKYYLEEKKTRDLVDGKGFSSDQTLLGHFLQSGMQKLEKVLDEETFSKTKPTINQTDLCFHLPTKELEKTAQIHLNQVKQSIDLAIVLDFFEIPQLSSQTQSERKKFLSRSGYHEEIDQIEITHEIDVQTMWKGNFLSEYLKLLEHRDIQSMFHSTAEKEFTSDESFTMLDTLLTRLEIFEKELDTITLSHVVRLEKEPTYAIDYSETLLCTIAAIEPPLDLTLNFIDERLSNCQILTFDAPATKDERIYEEDIHLAYTQDEIEPLNLQLASFECTAKPFDYDNQSGYLPLNQSSSQVYKASFTLAGVYFDEYFSLVDRFAESKKVATKTLKTQFIDLQFSPTQQGGWAAVAGSYALCTLEDHETDFNLMTQEAMQRHTASHIKPIDATGMMITFHRSERDIGREGVLFTHAIDQGDFEDVYKQGVVFFDYDPESISINRFPYHEIAHFDVPLKSDSLMAHLEIDLDTNQLPIAAVFPHLQTTLLDALFAIAPDVNMDASDSLSTYEWHASFCPSKLDSCKKVRIFASQGEEQNPTFKPTETVCGVFDNSKVNYTAAISSAFASLPKSEGFSTAFINLSGKEPDLLAPAVYSAKVVAIENAKMTNRNNRYISMHLAEIPGLEYLYTDSMGDEFDISVRTVPKKSGDGYLFSAQFTPVEKEDIDVPCNHIYFIVDRSSSIEEHRFITFKKSVNSALSFLDEKKARFNVGFFDYEVEWLNEQDVIPTKRQLTSIKRKLTNIDRRGKSNLTTFANLIDSIKFRASQLNEPHTVILLSDGRFMKNIRLQRQMLGSIASEIPETMTLFAASASDNNNRAMLNLLAGLFKGDTVHAKTHSAYARKVSALTKRVAQPLAYSTKITHIKGNEEATLFDTCDQSRHMYANKYFKVYGETKDKKDIHIMLQAFTGERFINIPKTISFKNAEHSPARVEQDIARESSIPHLLYFLRTGNNDALLVGNRILESNGMPRPSN